MRNILENDMGMLEILKLKEYFIIQHQKPLILRILRINKEIKINLAFKIAYMNDKSNVYQAMLTSSQSKSIW